MHIRTVAFAAAMLGAFSMTAARAESDSQKETANMNAYFKEKKVVVDAAGNAYTEGQTLPESVTLYTFEGRPEWADYRYTMSGGQFYVVDKNRRVMRTMKPENK